MAKTIQIQQTGGPEVMKLVDLPVGEPGPGEIRIRHHACGLNFIDVYQRTGLYPNPLPLTLGMEGAGVVEAVGEGVTHLKAGDRAAYASNPPGSYSEARVMPAKNVCKLPDAIAFETGAAMMLKGLTAQYLLKRTLPQGGLQAGDFVLFHAAAGGVGLIACQWAKALGLQLIGTAGSDEKCQLALRARRGASPSTTAAKTSSSASRTITGGKGVKVVYDSVGKDTFEGSLDCLRPVRPDGELRQRLGPGAAVRAGHPRRQGLAVRDAARRCSPTSPRARRTQAMADDLFAVVRQRRGEDPHRPALPAGRGGAGAPRPRSAQDHRLRACCCPDPARSAWCRQRSTTTGDGRRRVVQGRRRRRSRCWWSAASAAWAQAPASPAMPRPIDIPPWFTQSFLDLQDELQVGNARRTSGCCCTSARTAVRIAGA